MHDINQTVQLENSTMIVFLCLTFRLVSGSSLSDKVHQTPAESFYTSEETDAKISCTHHIQDYTQIYWYKQSQNDQLQLLGYMNVNNQYPETGINVAMTGRATKGETCTLTIKGLNPKSSAVYFCAASRGFNREAYFGLGTKLTVLETNREITGPTKVEILEPSEYECRNSKDRKRKKTLVCVASGFYPDHVSVSWIINDITVTDNVATDDAAHENGITYRITSRLRVYAPEWEHPGNTFKCNVTFFNGTGYTYHYSNEIHGVEAQAKGMTRDTFLTATQNFKLTYAVFIAKSCVYGVFVGFLVWKLQRSGGKQRYLDPR